MPIPLTANDIANELNSLRGFTAQEAYIRENHRDVKSVFRGHNTTQITEILRKSGHFPRREISAIIACL